MEQHRSRSPARGVHSHGSGVVYGEENTVLSESAATYNRVSAALNEYNATYRGSKLALSAMSQQEANSRWSILPFFATHVSNFGALEQFMISALGGAELHISSKTEVSSAAVAPHYYFNVRKGTIDKWKHSDQQPKKSCSLFSPKLMALLAILLPVLYFIYLLWLV